MEFNFIGQKVVVSSHTNTIDIDFEKLLKVVAGTEYDLNNLSEDNRDDIIAEFTSSNQNYYLQEACDIIFADLYEDESGYDIGLNAKELERLENAFAEFVYNYKNEK